MRRSILGGSGWARGFFFASLMTAVFSLSLATLGQSRHILSLPSGNAVPDAPFSAVRTLDFEPAAGSTESASHAEETLYRNSAGRVRAEFRYPSQLPTVDIVDLSAHTRFHWTVGDTFVTQSAVPLPKTPINVASSMSSAPPPDLPADAPLIEGLPTRYTRDVRGSDETNRTTVETWYSPALRLEVLMVVSSPVGKTSYRYTKIQRGEPEAALFLVPAGYTINNPSQAPPQPASPSKVATSDAVPHAAYMDDPKFQKAAAQARQTHNLEERLEDWKHANKFAGGQCIECLHAIIGLQIRFGATKDAVKSAEQLESVGAGDPHERYFAESMRGGALMSSNFGQPKPDQVAQADAAFRDVLAYSPKSRDVVYQEGRALAMLGKNDEAKAMFVRYVELAPASDKLRVRAERFSDDPHLATLQMAPPFRLVTTQGEELQLDEMNGRVVVLDFWATWCGPCKETLPEIKRIAKDYAKDPMLVLISISQDAEEGTWKEFVQKNNMDWPQYRDGNKTLGNAYGVTSIPLFFTIDTNGVLKSEQVGSGADVRRVVDDVVKKAHKAEARRTVGGQ